MQTTLFSVPTWLVLTAAGSIGIAGDALLRGGNMRAGLAIWLTALVASVLALGDRLSTERTLMLVGMALGGFGLVWRDSEMLYVIDLLSVICMGALTLWHGTGRTLGELTLVETVRAVREKMNLSEQAPADAQIMRTVPSPLLPGQQIRRRQLRVV